MPAQILRDYQESGRAHVFEAWTRGARSVLLTSPTGSGKTTIFCFIAQEVVSAGGRVVILVHRRELAQQACTRLREFGVDYGLIMSGESPKPYAKVQVATVQTLVRRQAPQAGLVICDEAHLSTAQTWNSIIEQYPRSRVLGCTATPWRLGGKPLIGSYDASVLVATPAHLREQGHLCQYVGFSYKHPDLSEIKTTGGDYNEKQTAEAMSSGLIVDSIIEEWLKHASTLSTVVFAVTVEHSQQLTARFRAAGVAAEHLDGTTGLEARRAILRRVETGVTRVLCNVGVAVEGLDIPRLKCCVLARPTKSLARAIQMMGRVRRPWEGVTARIHDHAFVIAQHGLPDAERDYTLSAKPEAPPSLTQCAECFALYQGASCPACGKEPEPREQTERVIQTVADAEQFGFTSADPGPPPMSTSDVKWNQPGRVIEGQLLRRYDERSDFGPVRKYIVKGAKRYYRLPGTVRLNALLAQIPDSSLIRVTQLEDTPLSSGRSRKEFKVEKDE